MVAPCRTARLRCPPTVRKFVNDTVGYVSCKIFGVILAERWRYLHHRRGRVCFAHSLRMVSARHANDAVGDASGSLAGRWRFRLQFREGLSMMRLATLMWPLRLLGMPSLRWVLFWYHFRIAMASLSERKHVPIGVCFLRIAALISLLQNSTHPNA